MGAGMSLALVAKAVEDISPAKAKAAQGVTVLLGMGITTPPAVSSHVDGTGACPPPNLIFTMTSFEVILSLPLSFQLTTRLGAARVLFIRGPYMDADMSLALVDKAAENMSPVNAEATQVVTVLLGMGLTTPLAASAHADGAGESPPPD